MEPIISISPTSYKTIKQCTRKASLDHLSLRGNIHFAYGHAYGHAAALLYKLADRHKEVRLGAAYAGVIPYSRPFDRLSEHYSNKTLSTILKGIQATDHAIQLLHKQYEFLDEEIKVILKVRDKSDCVFILSGTYDVRARSRVTNELAIFDFKAVTGDYLYSWETDPQCLIYSVLNQVVSNNLKLGDTYAATGKYLVHYTNKKDELFAIRAVDPAFYKFQAVPIITDLMSEAKKNVLNAQHYNNEAELLPTLHGNPYACNKNNYQCEYYPRCYNNKYDDLKGIPDDRTPTKVIILEVTYEEVLEATRQISSRAKSPIKMQGDDYSTTTGDDLDDLSLTDLDLDDTIDDILFNTD